ncbi:hypothetical protein PENTCL1PPCAC_5780, partial [Pristionchus entomophagus]
GMIYLLLLLSLPLLVFPQECGSHLSDDGNPLARVLDDQTHLSMEENRLIGGVETEPHSWPWTVQLVYMGGHRCGGALIARSFVVTAAHCFARSRLPDRYTVYTGGHTSMSGQEHKVLNISVHPLFNLLWPSSFDVAILKISPEVEMGERVQPICLPLIPPANNKMCVVAGWGLIHENGTRSTILREVHVPIVPFHVCNNFQHYGGRIHTPTMVCAGYSQGRVDSCQGDSGGPLMCEQAGKWELQGVVSWGIGCGRAGHPGVYARILPALGFIHTEMFLLR